MGNMIELRAEEPDTSTTAQIDLAAGGRLVQITVDRSGERIALLAEPPADASPWSSGWGSFPMAPWAGRIRNGRFTVAGQQVGLGLNHVDGEGTGGGPIQPPRPAPTGEITDADRRRHAIHGVVFTRTWHVIESSEDSVVMRCSLVDESATSLGWPFAGDVEQRIELRPDGIDLTLSVLPAADVEFPATIGWHPWFAKPERLELTPSAMYEVDDTALPTGRLVPPPPGPWDDCFINTDPVRLHYDRTVASTVTVTSDCDHLVVYDKPEHATCVEPQSGPPDAANVRPEITASGTPLRHTMTIGW